ncbi:hypothetical protein [Fimbriimonas ginsengisoli]|uniref:hypothetical protein n=1 Tax=Fimbriimonas ginsengisoli TaxID=1005039 RepID=UPI001187177A|nr:hypothetical protein [Fimbriimonas ginsengisoli]
MFFRKTSPSSSSGIVAACVAAIGAAVAITFFVKKTRSRRPSAVVDRCLRAVDELESRIITSAARA